MKLYSWILMLLLLGVISCQNEPVLEPLHQTNRSRAKKNVPAKKENIKTMTEDILYYSEIQSISTLTIYDAPAMYAFSIPQGTSVGQWNYTSAKLVYNSYTLTTSELYIFDNTGDYINADGCNLLWDDSKKAGDNTVVVCETGGTNCRTEGNCLVKCVQPAS